MADYFKYVNQEIPTTDDDVKMHLEETTQMKKKGLKICEFLIEGQLKPETFLRCLNHITQEIYDDVVDERALSKTCGYPLCSQVLTKQSNQRFCIDVRAKVIYDAKKLQKFCSKICYEASDHIKEQINTVLTRVNYADVKKFNLLSANRKADEEPTISSNQTKPLQVESAALKTKHNPPTKSEPRKEIEKINVVLDSEDVISKTKANENTETIKENIEPPNHPVRKSLFSQRRENAKGNNMKTNLRFQASEVEKLNPLTIIKSSVLEWFTIDTYKFLYGEDKVVEMVNKERLIDQFKTLNLNKISDDVETKCRKLIHKLKLDELEDKTVVDSYQHLQREAKSLDEKFEVSNNSKDQKVNFGMQIRRRQIFMKSIGLAMKKLTKTLGLPVHVVLEYLHDLLETFNLGTHNITFDPTVWTIISVILIQLLSICDEELRTKLQKTETIASIKETYQLIPEAEPQILEFLENVKDINIFLKNYLSPTGGMPNSNKFV